MKRRLEAASDNAELIEAEVTEGASQFFLWRNTHPDFDSFVRRTGYPFRTTAGGEETSSEKMVRTFKFWNQKMGRLASDLSNHCADRENYLAQKLRKGVH